MNAAGAGRELAYDCPPDVVCIWRLLLDSFPASPIPFKDILSQDELDRANRFHFQRDRHRFIVARGALRLILGRCLGIQPQLLAFACGPQGKPYLAGAVPEVRFNVSHSGDLALIAVSRGRELGVDVEQVRPLAGNEQIPERFFSQSEVSAFRKLPADARERAFFACWTRKEAYIKARGGGLSIPLNGFDVSLDPGVPAELLHVKEDPLEAARWNMVALEPAEGYAGALVAQGKDWHYEYRELPSG